MPTDDAATDDTVAGHRTRGGVVHAAGILAVTEHLPERVLERDEVLFDEGDGDTAALAVLVDGWLRVELAGATLSDIREPGSFIGEIGALLGQARTATVVAGETSTVRVISDPEAFFAAHPGVGLDLAKQLASRLQRLLAYLTDLRAQYGDADGHLGMIDSVLGRLATRRPVDIDPGSDRSPDY